MIYRCLLAITALLISTTITAKEDALTIKVDSTDDFKKFCYYEGKAFSEGSRLKQVSQLKKCTRNEKGFLYWQDTAS